MLGSMSSASALSLGEATLASYLGEPFVAHIAIQGDLDKNVRFSQVRTGECLNSLIAKTPNGCDAIYDRFLTFSIKRNAAGKYYLQVNGERGEDLFYRIIVKTQSSNTGIVYNAFEFLPDLKPGLEPTPLVVHQPAIINPASAPVAHGENDKILNKYNALTGGAASAVKAAEPRKQAEIKPAKLPPKTPPVKPMAVRNESTNSGLIKKVLPPPAKKVQPASRLEIKKSGEYEDDLYALQKENDAILEQIALLEKQIALYRKVDRLKGVLGGVSAPLSTQTHSAVSSVALTLPIVGQAMSGDAASAVPVVSALNAPLPIVKPAQVQAEQQADSDADYLLWGALSAGILLLVAGLGYREYTARKKIINLNYLTPNSILHPNKDDRASLDLTRSSEAQKW